MLVRMQSNWSAHTASGGCVNGHNHSGKLGVSTETAPMAHSLPWYRQAHRNACAWMLQEFYSPPVVECMYKLCLFLWCGVCGVSSLSPFILMGD